MSDETDRNLIWYVRECNTKNGSAVKIADRFEKALNKIEVLEKKAFFHAGETMIKTLAERDTALSRVRQLELEVEHLMNQPVIRLPDNKERDK